MLNVEVILSVSGSVVDNTFLFISDITRLTPLHSYINQLTRDGKIELGSGFCRLRHNFSLASLSEHKKWVERTERAKTKLVSGAPSHRRRRFTMTYSNSYLYVAGIPKVNSRYRLFPSPVAD